MFPPKPVKVEQRLAEESMKEERLHDVLLLIKHLAKREEVTIKLIIDRLYDVGSVNLINKKLPYRPLNGVAKSIARMSKSAFRLVALRWFYKNCPQLITKWLNSKVSFTDSNERPKEPIAVVSDVQLYSLPAAKDTSREEIKSLRSQVRYLTGISVGAIAALAGTVILVGNDTSSQNYSLPTHIMIRQQQRSQSGANIRPKGYEFLRQEGNHELLDRSSAGLG